MYRSKRIKVKNHEEKKRKRKFIKVLVPLFIVIFVGITATGTYAYFTAVEKILPAPIGATPTYNQFQITYPDHSESQVLDNGVTIYLDISGLLNSNTSYEWSGPNCSLYFFCKDSGGTTIRKSTWESTSMSLRFGTISTITPSDLTKCKTSKSVNGVITDYVDPLGSITWSGCWLKYKITDPNFNLSSGETRRIIIRRNGNLNDQTANNMQISSGVKEVYIKAKAYLFLEGGSDSNYDWSKLEIKY